MLYAVLCQIELCDNDYVVTLLTQLTNEYHSWLQLTSHSKQGSNQLLSLAHIFWGETGSTDVEECSVRFISNSFGLERTRYCEWRQVDLQNITALVRFDKTISKFNYIKCTGLCGAKPLTEPMLIIFALLKVPNLIEVFPLRNATFLLLSFMEKHLASALAPDASNRENTVSSILTLQKKISEFSK